MCIRDSYWDAEHPFADEIDFLVVPDDNTRIMQLQAGQVDIATGINAQIAILVAIGVNSDGNREVIGATAVSYTHLKRGHRRRGLLEKAAQHHPALPEPHAVFPDHRQYHQRLPVLHAGKAAHLGRPAGENQPDRILHLSGCVPQFPLRHSRGALHCAVRDHHGYYPAAIQH